MLYRNLSGLRKVWEEDRIVTGNDVMRIKFRVQFSHLMHNPPMCDCNNNLIKLSRVSVRIAKDLTLAL